MHDRRPLTHPSPPQPPYQYPSGAYPPGGGIGAGAPNSSRGSDKDFKKKRRRGCFDSTLFQILWRRKCLVFLWLVAAAGNFYTLFIYLPDVVRSFLPIYWRFEPTPIHDVELYPPRVGFTGIDRPDFPATGGPMQPEFWHPKYYNATTGRPVRPLPTSKWWNNFVLYPAFADNNGINQNPYLLSVIKEASEVGFRIFSPYTLVEIGNDGYISRYRSVWRPRTIAMSVVLHIDPKSKVKHYVETFDEMSLTKTLEFKEPGEKEFKVIRNWIVPGANLITMEFPAGSLLHLTPEPFDTMDALSNRVVLFGTPSQQYDCTNLYITDRPVLADEFWWQLEHGSQWVMFTSEPIEVYCHFDHQWKSYLYMLKPLPSRTIVRMGVVNNCNVDHVRNADPAKMIGEQEICNWGREMKPSTVYSHMRTYPVGTEVRVELENDEYATMHYTYKLRRMFNSNKGDDFLILLNPLQRLLIQPPDARPTQNRTRVAQEADKPKQCISTVHGELCGYSVKTTPVNAATHSHVAVISFRHIPLIKSNFSTNFELLGDWIDPLKKMVKNDLIDRNVLPSTFAMKGMFDPSHWGKLMHRYSRIALIGDEIGETDWSKAALGYVKDSLSTWLRFESGNVLMYDEHWGGIISCGCQMINERCANAGPVAYDKEGCPSLLSHRFDEGLAFYNNHAGVFGYFVYMAAVVALLEPDFPGQPIRVELDSKNVRYATFHEAIIALILDFANPGNLIIGKHGYSDTNLQGRLQRVSPVARHKDWWYGFSFGAGNAASSEFGLGTESISEQAFAYYAVALYGKAVKDKDLERWGRFLASMEILGGNTYFHVHARSETYPLRVRQIYNVGSLTTLEVRYQSSFGPEGFKGHGVQFVPITPLLLELIEPNWMLWQMDRWGISCTKGECLDSGWVSALTGARIYSMNIRGDSALSQIKQLSCYREGIRGCDLHTPTNMVWWAAVSEAVGGAQGLLRLGSSTRNYNFSIY